jgi:excisionase family DNA binding protein
MQRKQRSNGKRSRKNKRKSHTESSQKEQALLVSIATAAAMLGRSKSGVFKLMQSGELKALKCGRRTMIAVAEIHRYIESLPVRTAGEFTGIRFHSISA